MTKHSSEDNDEDDDKGEVNNKYDEVEEYHLTVVEKCVDGGDKIAAAVVDFDDIKLFPIFDKLEEWRTVDKPREAKESGTRSMVGDQTSEKGRGFDRIKAAC